MILFFLLPPTSNTVNKKGHPATISVKTSKKKTTFATYQHCFDLHIAQTLTSRLYKLTMTVSNNLPTCSPNLPTLPLYSQHKTHNSWSLQTTPNLEHMIIPELLTALKNHTLYNKLLFFFSSLPLLLTKPNVSKD